MAFVGTKCAMQHAMSRYRLTHDIGPLLAIVIFIAIGVGVLFGTQRFIRDAALVSHTNGVIARVTEIEARLRDTESAQRGYLLTGRAEYLADYSNSRAQLPDLLAELRQQTGDDDEQQRRVARFERLIEQRLQQLERTLSVYRNDGLAAASAAIDQNVQSTSTGIRVLSKQMLQVERGLLTQRAESSRESALLLRSLAIAGIPFGLLVLGLIYRLMRREIRGRAAAEGETARSNARLQAFVGELERHGGDLSDLSRFGSMLQSCVSADEALQLTADLMSRLAPGSGGTVYRIRASKDYAEAMTHWGAHAASSQAIFSPDDCWAMRRGQPYSIHHDGLRCKHVEVGAAEDVASTCIPLIAQGNQLGFVYLSSTRQDPPGDLQLIEAAAEQLAMALSNLELQERLRIQSIREPLTGLYNRRYLEESLDRELSRCERRQLPVALMMMDLDHFKRFNDMHGHGGGDALLAGFGRLLRELSRPEDIACRYGGEEFTLILPEATEATAQARAEDIRAAVKAMRVEHLGSELPEVTVSIGVAMFPEQGSTPDALLRRADKALYRAKREGRNRVVIADAVHEVMA